MQANYPKKRDLIRWDPVHIEYPVWNTKDTGTSSESLSHRWRPQGEVLRDPKGLYPDVKLYERNFDVTNHLIRSKTNIDFDYKASETTPFYKHSSCVNQNYIYPPNRKLTDRVPAQHVFGTTEMKESYKRPTTPPRLVTNKDQFKNIASLPLDPPPVDPSWNKLMEPLDTTQEGYEIYMDPYLTTSRLHHRPYTAEQLRRPSNTKDIVTYYTFNKTPWTRTQKQGPGEYWLPRAMPKSMYDREKFKQDCREVRTHNKLHWVPGSFQTESQENFTKPAYQIQNYDEYVQNHYKRILSKFPTKLSKENILFNNYCTENGVIGSGKPICSVFDQHLKINKRLIGKHL